MAQGENDEEQPIVAQTDATADKDGTEETKETEDTASEEDTEKSDEQDNEDSEEQADKADEEGSEEPEKPVSRAQARIRRQAEELKTERVEKEKLIAERAVAQAQLENLRRQQQELVTQEQRRTEEARLALLDPQEKALYQANQRMRELEYKLNQLEIQRQDDRDRANFHAKAQNDETYAKYADSVEQMYQDGLSRGVSASREDLHSYILGKELKKDMASKISQKREKAGKRIESVTSKPANAKGDVAGSKKGKSEEDRLRGVLI